MEEIRDVNYKVRFIGPETTDLIPGDIYECIAERYDEDGILESRGIIDRSDDSYWYRATAFERIDDQKDDFMREILYGNRYE